MGRASDYEISRQMSLLRAATVTRIDEELSPENVTAIHGETALLVCTVLNVGDKAVSFIFNNLGISLKTSDRKFAKNSRLKTSYCR